MTIKVISQDSIARWAEAKGVKEPEYKDLTDEEFAEINDVYESGWHFDSLEEFVDAFNRDDNSCPVPTCHFVRIYQE